MNALELRDVRKVYEVGDSEVVALDHAALTVAQDEIVALVADTRFGGLKSEPIPEIYIPHLQNQYLDLNVVIRTREAPRRIARAAGGRSTATGGRPRRLPLL